MIWWLCSRIGHRYRPRDYAVDGLNSLSYKLVGNESQPLYTWLQVQLPPQPTYFTGKNMVNLRRH